MPVDVVRFVSHEATPQQIMNESIKSLRRGQQSVKDAQLFSKLMTRMSQFVDERNLGKFVEQKRETWTFEG